LADLRAAGGDRDPFPVKYWGVGNESWGCGGNFTGDEYAVEYRKYVEWVPRFGAPLSFIASGPNVADYAWTRTFLTKLTEKNRGPLRNLYGLALHYYTGTTGKGSATDFTIDDWYALLSKAVRMDELIRNHWQIMGELDNQHQVKLVVDEWGAWHQTADVAPGYLFGYFPTMRDALVSGLTLDIFNQHADKVAMANAAQLINNIHSSFMAAGDKFTLTPIFHVFEMYAPHQGGPSVRTEISVPRLKPEAAKGLPILAGSCSIQGNRGVLTITNSDAQNPQEAEIAIRSGRISDVRATVLKSADIRAHNSFESPNVVAPVSSAVSGGGPQRASTIAPAAVTRLDFNLARAWSRAIIYI
jgi:alpha-N-arabinofuranosidase